MEVNIPYDQGYIPIQIPDTNLLGVYQPNRVQIGDEQGIVHKSLEYSIDSPSFSSFLRDARDILILVNDATRPTPTSRILEIISSQIQNMDINFLIATGNHRSPTKDEIRFIFGPFYEVYKDRIHFHVADNEDEMVYLGTTKNGTEMVLNRLGIQAQKLVIIGSVEPHYFAGYTGGRKSIIPGIAARRTIEQNHKHALLPEACLLGLSGNPVHDDMMDALSFIADKEIFSIQTVLDYDRKIYAATAGNIHASFQAAIEKANDVYAVRVPEKADIVISVAPYPMDIDLYQSQKALESGKLALKRGGILILVSKCRTGVGDETFIELLTSVKTPQEVMERIQAGYVLGYHKAVKMAEISLWAEMWAKTDLSPEVIRSVYMKPVEDLQKSLDAAIRKKGKNAKVLILMDGSITVPIVH